MLVENAPVLPEGGEWDYELSWPGDRILATKEGPSVRLTSALQRRDLTNRFPVIAAGVAKVHAELAVLDGVARSLDASQQALFGEEAEPASAIAIRFIVTDLLSRDALDARQLPLTMRREQLRATVAGTGILVAPTLAGSVAEMLAEAVRVGADGIVAKRRASRYRPFSHVGDWIRVAVPPAGGASGQKSGRDPSSTARHVFDGREGGSFGGGWRPATA